MRLTGVYCLAELCGGRNRWAAGPPRKEDVNDVMEPKIADYLASIASLIVIATVDWPGLVSLRFDLTRMPNVDIFRQNVYVVVRPILDKFGSGLPPESYRA